MSLTMLVTMGFCRYPGKVSMVLTMDFASIPVRNDTSTTVLFILRFFNSEKR